jgi:hypothetical protein
MKENPTQRDIRTLQAYSKHIFTGKVGWGAHPPHLNFKLIESLFELKKPNLGYCEWGLKFEHTFTGKISPILRELQSLLQTFPAYHQFASRNQGAKSIAAIYRRKRGF